MPLMRDFTTSWAFIGLIAPLLGRMTLTREDFTTSWAFIGLIALLMVLLCLVAPPLLAARKEYAWYLWTFACGLLGLVVLAFLPYANRPDVSEEVNRSRCQTGNIVGGVLTAVGLLVILAQCTLVGLGLALRLR
jgi:hypothetical protein